MTTETTEQPDTRLIPLRSHDVAIAKLQPALQYDITTDAKLVDRARKDAKQVRCAIESARKKLVEDAVAWQREVNAVAKDITARVSPIEEHCERIEAEHAAEKKRKQEEAAAAEKARRIAARIAEARALRISDEAKARVMPEMQLAAPFESDEMWAERIKSAMQIDTVIAEEKAAAAAREAEEARLKSEREELTRQRAEIEAERKRLADEQAKREAEERAKRQVEEAEARRVAAEEWQRKLAQSQREEAEQKERNAKDEQERHAANEQAHRILGDFITAVQTVRPSRKSLLFGPQLDVIIERGIEAMAIYYHNHIRDHYDARKDI